MNWTDALAIAKRGFDNWASKDHNKKWVRLIDGTPIENDLLVNIAQAFQDVHDLKERVESVCESDESQEIAAAAVYEHVEFSEESMKAALLPVRKAK